MRNKQNPPRVFVSYSHKDEEWLQRLLTHLKVVCRKGALTTWADTDIEPGEDWGEAIEEAIETCQAAILLVSADYLTSGFVLGQEVPELLLRRAEHGIRVIPLIVSPCAWQETDDLSRLEARPKGATPLSTMSRPEADAALAALTREIKVLVAGRRGSSAVPPAGRSRKSSLGFSEEIPASRREDQLLLRTDLEAALKRAGWSERERENAVVVYSELVSNAFDHGVGEGGEGKVGIVVLANPLFCRIIVRDPGRGFDLSQEIERQKQSRPRKGSMGLQLVEALSRELRTNEEGNEITALVFRTDAIPGSDSRFAIRLEQGDEVAVIAVKARRGHLGLFQEEFLPEFKKALRDCGREAALIDLSQVVFADSSDLGCLVELLLACKRSRKVRRFAVCLKKRFLDWATICQVHLYGPLFASRIEALESLEG